MHYMFTDLLTTGRAVEDEVGAMLIVAVNEMIGEEHFLWKWTADIDI